MTNPAALATTTTADALGVSVSEQPRCPALAHSASVRVCGARTLAVAHQELGRAQLAQRRNVGAHGNDRGLRAERMRPEDDAASDRGSKEQVHAGRHRVALKPVELRVSDRAANEDRASAASGTARALRSR